MQHVSTGATTIEIISVKETARWSSIVSLFATSDIYYKIEYIRSLLTCINAQGILFYFQGIHSKMCYPMLILDISKDNRFIDSIPDGSYFDMETPYGYGGPLFDVLNDEDIEVFKRDLNAWGVEHNIVSQFVRFNPVLNNVEQSKGLFDGVEYVHHTISIDTSHKELIMFNMDTKNRNMVRKAVRNGVIIEFDNKLESLEEFKMIYLATMDHHNAHDKYYFPDTYYDYLKTQFLDHTIILRAVYKEKTIGSSLFFYNDSFMHYHLSGTLYEYRNLASTNLLLYEAACWAADKGIQELHLGGGLADNDSLFGFKKQFNKNGHREFWIGRTVFDQDKYRELLSIRKQADPTFDIENSYMIQYRR